MLSIFICEDDLAQKQLLEEMIKKFIMIEDYDMEIALSTTNPYDILKYLENTKTIRGIYFLDVELNQTINGIELGSNIRKIDIDGKIIFITTHSESLSLTFTYKVEAMDYIIKDNLELVKKQIHECLQLANEYYLSSSIHDDNLLQLKINNQTRIFSLEEIQFFETTELPHKLRLHLSNGTLELYDSLNNIEKLSEKFVRIHKSYLVNKENVRVVDGKKREVVMDNGETCLISVRKIKLLN